MEQRPDAPESASNAFYRDNARSYFRATAGVDPSAFLRPLASRLAPGARILDVGCGSGRDLLWLKERGFRVKGLERSPELAALAREHAGCEVEVNDFLTRDFSGERFDALLLVGALVHLEKARAGYALAGMLPALTEPGLLLASLKEGTGQQELGDGRVFVLWTEEEARSLFASLGLEVVHAERGSSAVRTGDVWLGYVLRRAVTDD